jgi:CDP-diacylglycerol--serine O-phosphatidyltransferase
MKKQIPNFITILNLLAGTLAIFMVLNEQPQAALILFVASLVFDFGDGLAARLLKADSEIGKQLDSLADLISFGLVPAAMIFMVMKNASVPEAGQLTDLNILQKGLLLSVLIVPALAAVRLARFNLLPPADFFLGLPTPAFALFWMGIYYDFSVNQSIFGQSVSVWFLWTVMVLMSLFMLVPLPMLSLKFSSFKIITNFSRYLLILVSAVILLFTGVTGLPLVVLTYILLSLIKILLT